jgi:hypothetical protein
LTAKDKREGQQVLRMQNQKPNEQIKKREIQQQEIQNLLLYLSWNEMGILDGGTLSRIAADIRAEERGQ